MSSLPDEQRFSTENRLRIGPYLLDTKTLVAPMAGITDRPFRLLCKQLGARYAVSEMVTSDPSLYESRKSRLRRQHAGEAAPIAVQIAGADPEYLAQAAQFNAEHGAQVIDINMGCPAKKVCRKAAGSALLADEALVKRCLHAVSEAVSIPVTLKIRTGSCNSNRNATTIARLAEQAGIQMLVVHGRTREQKYQGKAEYETIRQVVESVSIPVIANGDIHSPAKAAEVLALTGADGVMIGRAGQGRPWLYQQIDHYLATGETLPEPATEKIAGWLMNHVRSLHEFYGERQGVRVARKHIDWYLQTITVSLSAEQHHARQKLVRIDEALPQLIAIDALFSQLINDLPLPLPLSEAA